MKKKPLCIVVEDDQLNNRMISKILKKQNYDVLQAYDGEEAIDIIHNNAVDLVFLDLMMPKKNGYEVCEYIKNNMTSAYIPVVIITSLEEQSDKIRAIEKGADDFLRKPIDPIELILRAKTLLKLKMSFDQLEQHYEQMKQQMQIAKSLYTELIPSEELCFKGVHIQWLTIEDQWISGDWFHFHRNPDGKIIVLLTDAVGHGVSATLISTMIHSIYQELLLHSTPSLVMKTLNQKLYHSLGGNDRVLYCSAALLWIDPQKNKMEYVSAGHPPIYIRFSDGIKLYEHPHSGPPLGLKENFDYEPVSVSSVKELLLYTDGLLDLVDYQFDELLNLLNQDGSWDTHCLLKQLDLSKQTDDITLIAIKMEDDCETKYQR